MDENTKKAGAVVLFLIFIGTLLVNFPLSIGAVSYHFVYDENSGSTNPVWKVKVESVAVEQNSLYFTVDPAQTSAGTYSTDKAVRVDLKGKPTICTYNIQPVDLGNLYSISGLNAKLISYGFGNRQYFSLTTDATTKIVDFTVSVDGSTIGTGSFDSAKIGVDAKTLYNNGGYIRLTPSGLSTGNYKCPSASDVVMVYAPDTGKVYITNKQDYKDSISDLFALLANINAVAYPPTAYDWSKQVSESYNVDLTGKKLKATLNGDATANFNLVADAKFFSSVVEVSQKLSKPELTCIDDQNTVQGKEGYFTVKVKNIGEGTTPISITPTSSIYTFSPRTSTINLASGAEQAVEFKVGEANSIGTENINVLLSTSSGTGVSVYETSGVCQIRGLSSSEATITPVQKESLVDQLNTCYSANKDPVYENGMILCRDKTDWNLIAIIGAIGITVMGVAYILNMPKVRARRRR